MTSKTYTVGGAVRDALMNILPKDIDYGVVGSTVEEMLAKGFKQVGADFPVFLDEYGVEYALARTEVKTGPGYHGFDTRFDPSVTIEDDLYRRDLTINAMAMDSDDNLIDPYGGAEDLRKHKLKHVSEAFREDPVRVLRLARFYARLGRVWHIDGSTLDLCKDMVKAGELNHLTKERIWLELNKTVEESGFGVFDFLEVLDMVGALEVIFPLISKHAIKLDYIFHFMDQSPHGSSVDIYYWLFCHLSDTEIKQFFIEYKMPMDLCADILMIKKINAFDVSSSMDEIVSFMEKYKFYQKDNIFARYYTFSCVNKLNYALFAFAHTESKDISWASLSVEEQDTLTGKQVGQAIHDLRVKTLTEL